MRPTPASAHRANHIAAAVATAPTAAHAALSLIANIFTCVPSRIFPTGRMRRHAGLVAAALVVGGLGGAGGFVMGGVSRRGPAVVHSGGDGAKEPKKDPIEKMFNFFFGEIEAEPLGLTRMSVETAPDQYPADVTGRAEAVAGDDEECARFVRPTLKQTGLERRELQLVYEAKRDGFTPEAFHRAVDRRGPGIVLAVSTSGLRFGGYNPKGWVGYGEYRPGLSAFLYVWKGDRLVKLRKVGGAGMCVVDKPEEGPMFGAEGLCVPMRASSPRRARVKLGPYYERMPGGGTTLFDDGEMAVDLANLLVYTGVYAEDEPIPFDDAIPFSLT